MQALQRHGYLDGTRTIFDYGCGKGDDIRILRHNGLDASGWDPHFTPDIPKEPADIVNLGFVINVIEDTAGASRGASWRVCTRQMCIICCGYACPQ